MLILFETPAGYALFRCDEEKKISKVENILKYFDSEANVRKLYAPRLMQY